MQAEYKRTRGRPLMLMLLSLSFLGACSDIGGVEDRFRFEPQVSEVTRLGAALRALPPASRRVDVTVYAYEDQTGQQKPNDNFADFSKAVTQGADAVLIDVLMDVGEGAWFRVNERVGLQNLLTERQLIDQTNTTYRGTTESELPPLRFSGTILEGGIIDYDSNIMTGGAGARFLGIGASTQYRQDRVLVALRAVSVSTGEVLASVTAEKTVYSFLVRGDVFRFVSVDEILELETGYSRNEPTGIAVRQTIELAVYSLILEGAERGLWSFRNKPLQQHLISHYRANTDGSGGALQSLAAKPASSAAPTADPQVVPNAG